MEDQFYIALCGAPGAGKTTIANILNRLYSAQIVDDGLCLRQACMKLYNLTWDDVATQEGKNKTRMIGGRLFTHRQLLGDLGALLEQFYGEQFMPERALESIAGQVAPAFVFPSCRKTQGITYNNAGGVVVEVVRPGFEPINDFDFYDKSLVKYHIFNDVSSNWMQNLVEQVAAIFDPYFE